jgi:uncharacterized membrane protein YfcA
VLLAAFVVKELPMEMLRWLVIVVVVYTAIIMLRGADYIYLVPIYTSSMRLIRFIVDQLLGG